jgi:transcriptional regulator with XRE-family HTH domain
MAKESGSSEISYPESPENLVGQRLRELRARHGFALRALAERSGLNINTLSLIENGRSSPSVSTLQQLARALGEPISTFFETGPVQQKLVLTRWDQRPQTTIGGMQMQNLGKNLSGNVIQPFVITLPPGTGSGDSPIVHTGHELVYCLQGSILYRVAGEEYVLGLHDSLVFEAHLPHCWRNPGPGEARFLLAFFPTDVRDKPGEKHFIDE